MDGPDALGHAGLREMAEYARQMYRDVVFDIYVEWTKADGLCPNVAHASGTWRMALVPVAGGRAGELARLRGRFAETWHRDPGDAWRLYRDMTLSREPDAYPRLGPGSARSRATTLRVPTVVVIPVLPVAGWASAWRLARTGATRYFDVARSDATLATVIFPSVGVSTVPLTTGHASEAYGVPARPDFGSFAAKKKT